MKGKGLKFIAVNVMAILVCMALLLGSTFAWFSDSSSSQGNIIASGSLKVKAYWMNGAKNPVQDDWTSFEDGSVFTYENLEPGYTISKHIKVANEGSLAFKYNLVVAPTGEVSDLADVIDVYYFETAKVLGRADIKNAVPVGTLADLLANQDGAGFGVLLPENSVALEDEAVGSVIVTIALRMNEEAGDEYQGLSIGDSFELKVYASQYSYEADDFGSDYDLGEVEPDAFDGTIDTSWYNPNEPELAIESAEAFAGLRSLIEGIDYQTAVDNDFVVVAPIDEAEIPSTWSTTFEGQTIKLETDINLYIENEEGEAVAFDPIGSYRFEKAFSGVFDGQGHTIYNLNQNTWELNNGYYYNDLGLGLFGLIENATIKNLTLDGVNISGESAICGGVAATAFGECVFENVTIKNANIADYQYYAGGIVGWASGNHVYQNCVIDETATIAAQWGDFDNSIGGVIGGASGSATILMKDCVVACRIDAYSDATSSYQWYAYRRAGMLIGNSGKTIDVDGSTIADAPQLTCENVSVIYGEWANYTYCKFAGTSWPFVRVQAGVSNSGYSNPRYGHPTDANGNTVVDDNHVHNDGEDHLVLIEFDQLYGGGQGVYGAKTHQGVTITYNNR